LADDVTVSFAASIEKLIAGIEGAKSALEGFTAPFEKITSAAGKIGEALASAFAVHEIDEFFRRMAELGVQTQRTAALLGVSTSAVSGLDIAAQASGGTLEGMTSSLERFGLNLVKGAAGSKQQEAALRALGLSAKDFVGVPLPDVLGKLADHFSVLKDGIDKDAIAIALLGRAGAQMIPLFNQGSGAFKEFAEMAERSGSAMSKETAAGFEHTHLGLIELGKSFQGVGISVATIFKPAFDGIVKVLIDVVQGFNNSVRQSGAMKTLLEALAGAAKVVATAFASIVAVVEASWAAIKSVFENMGTAARGLGAMISAAFHGDLPGVQAAWNDMLKGLNANTVSFGKELINIWSGTRNELVTIWDAGAHKEIEIEQTKTARMQIANRDQVAAAMKAIDEQIRLVQEGLKRHTLVLDAEVKQHAITQNQKFAQLEAYTEQAYQAELALLQKESAIAGMSLAQQQTVQNKIAQLKSKHTTDMLKLDEQSVAAQQQIYTNFFSSIEGAFNSQLRGLLAGTTTWAAAFKNIIGDLLIKFIEFCEKTVLEWAAAQLAKTTASQTGAAAQAAAEVGGQVSTLPARAGKFISDITADAAAVFAGVFANLAPLLGPAAAGPAGVSQATVLAQLAAVPKFDVGTNLVTQTGVALVHAGEEIKPARGNGPYTGGGGDVHHHWNISAVDARSFVAMLSDNRSALYGLLQKGLRNNAIPMPA
jgi:hypothetical protein